MPNDSIEKGVIWFIGAIIAFFFGCAVGGFAGMLLLNNVYIGVFAAIFGGIITNRIFTAWWIGMIRAQKNPVMAVILFLFMFFLLAAGIVFYAKDISR